MLLYAMPIISNSILPSARISLAKLSSAQSFLRRADPAALVAAILARGAGVISTHLALARLACSRGGGRDGSAEWGVLRHLAMFADVAGDISAGEEDL